MYINFMYIFIIYCGMCTFRYEKCLTCHSHLIGLREDIYQLATDPKSKKAIKDQGIVNIFSILD